MSRVTLTTFQQFDFFLILLIIYACFFFSFEKVEFLSVLLFQSIAVPTQVECVAHFLYDLERRFLSL